MVKIRRKIYGFMIFSFLMGLSGLVMAFCTSWSLTHFAKTAALWVKMSFVPSFFYYYYLPLPYVKIALFLRLLLAIFQIFVAIFFYELRPWSLKAFRILMIFGVTTTFLNPFYPTIFVLFSTIYYLIFLIYLFHPKTETIFNQGYVMEASQLTGTTVSDLEQNKHERSRGVVVFGSMELLITLLMLRVWWWTVPLGGVVLQVFTRFGNKIPVSASKVLGLTILLIIYLVSLLTLLFKPIGRKLNLVFCVVGMIATIGLVFMINQAKSGVDQVAYLFFVVFTLFCSFLGFALLTNPRIRAQFVIKPVKLRWKFVSFLATMFVLFLAVMVLNISVKKYPWLFDKMVMRNVVFDSGKSKGNTDQGFQWESLTKEFKRLYGENDVVGAEKIGQKALKLAEQLFGPDHENTAVSLNNLGLLYLSAKRYSDAEFLLKRSLKINEQVLGSEHPKIGMDMNNLAELYRVMGDYPKAEDFYKKALMICEKVYGPDSMYAQVIRENLVNLRETIEDEKIRKQEVVPTMPSIFDTPNSVESPGAPVVSPDPGKMEDPTQESFKLEGSQSQTQTESIVTEEILNKQQ